MAWLNDSPGFICVSRRIFSKRRAPKVAQAWIADDQVLPLLDGLDEVAEKHRDGCVEEINAFSEEHGLLPLVVCSRSADYEALNKQLRLRGAVTIQPLTREQVKQYLERVGRAVSGVRAALRDDETLWELLDTPLMLSIFALTYQGRMASEITIVRHKGSLEERRAALLDAYIEAMFARRETTAPYTPKQTRQWLGWLAQSMLRHDRSTFYPQWMEHPTLPSETNRHLKREGKRLVVVAIALIVTGISIWSLWKPVWSSEVALSHGLFFGVLFGTPFFVNVLAKSRRRLMPSKPLIALVIAWLIARPSDIEFTELLLGANAQWPLVVLLLVLPVVPIVGILFGEFGGAIIGSCFGLLRGLIERLWNTFRDGGHEVELKRTAIEGMMTGAGQGVWPGFVVGLGLWLFDGLTGIDLNEWLPLWLLVWFAIWIVDILLAGALVVLFLGVLAGLAPALLSGLLGGLFEGLASGLLGGVGLAYLALAVFIAASLGSLDKESLGIHQMGFWMGGSLAAPTVWVISAGFAAGLFGGPLVGIFGAALMMVLLGPFLWLGAKEVMPNVKWPVDDVVGRSRCAADEVAPP